VGQWVGEGIQVPKVTKFNANYLSTYPPHK